MHDGPHSRCNKYISIVYLNSYAVQASGFENKAARAWLWMILMQYVYIDKERAGKLKGDAKAVSRMEKLCSCKIAFEEDGSISVSGDAYGEFNARNIIYAYGCGFSEKHAELLAKDDYYSDYIDIKGLGNPKRIRDVKARVIGTNGKSKKYIEGVSGALVSVREDIIGIIGSVESIGEAKAAIMTLVEGGTHKLAYLRMEAAHRKHKAERLVMR